jgi:hypothetical protein
MTVAYPVVLFTTIHFLRNLQMTQQARVFVPLQALSASVTQHSSLLGPLASYKENAVL